MKVTHKAGAKRVGERSQGVFRGRGGERGKGRQHFNKAIVECFNCHKVGYFQYKCPSWEKGANYTKLEEEEKFLRMSFADVKCYK